MITYSKLCDKVVEYQHNWGVTNNVNVGEFLKKLGKRGCVNLYIQLPEGKPYYIHTFILGRFQQIQFKKQLPC
jgi:hypothetical protein